MKRRELKSVTTTILENFSPINYEEYFDEISHSKGVCIELMNDDVLLYTSGSFNRGCMLGDNLTTSYKKDFMDSGLTTKVYELLNPRFQNKALLSAFRLTNDWYLFVSVSLEPLDSATIILKEQLIYITIIVFLLSFVVSYFISKKISNPILAINQKVKTLSKGNYTIPFKTNTKIEEIKELENNLSDLKDELAKTEELRMELLSNVSHDLKTPLTMIKAYAEMVRDLTYSNEEKRNQNLNTIIEEADRLNLLVNDILTLSITESNIYKPKYEKIALKELIETILSRYEILKETENYQIDFICEKEVQIQADKKQLEQVIYNLINNAINYTGPDKKVTVKVRVNGEVARVEVTDTGKGLDNEEKKNIWTRYYHSEKKHARGVVGTGLGLSIVKNILENHQFPYGVLSKKGKGTTFYFEMPIC